MACTLCFSGVCKGSADGGGVTVDAAVVQTACVDAGVALPAIPAVPSMPNPDQNLGGALSFLVDQFKGGNWRIACAALIVLFVWAFRKFGSGIPRINAWIRTDRGGVGITLIFSALGATVTILLSNRPFTGWMLVDGLSMALTAAGGYAIIKKLFWPVQAPVPTSDPVKPSVTDKPQGGTP